MHSRSKTKTLAILSQMRLMSREAESVSKLLKTGDLSPFSEWRSSLGVFGGNSIERLRIPCFSAFRREAALPDSVRGPVERLALARFACSFRSEIGRLTCETSCSVSRTDVSCSI